MMARFIHISGINPIWSLVTSIRVVLVAMVRYMLLLRMKTRNFIQPQFYGITKQVQEQLVLLCSATIGIPAIALRYQNVYGPGHLG